MELVELAESIEPVLLVPVVAGLEPATSTPRPDRARRRSVHCIRSAISPMNTAAKINGSRVSAFTFQ